MVYVNEGFFNAPNLGGAGSHGLHYFDYGTPDAAKTVFCVHGLTRNAADFEVLARALAQRGCRVLALSMAGRGKSEWLEDKSQYHYGTYAADCVAFLDNFHLRNVDWVGTSMGGIIAMMVAASSPKRIRRLVLNDVGSLIPAAGLKIILDYVSRSPKRFETLQEAQQQLQSNMKSFGIQSDDDWQRLFESSIEPDAQGGFRFAYDPDILTPARLETENFTKVADVPLGALWEAIAIPVLILRGAQSSLLLPETVAGMCSVNPKAESIEIEGVGHAPSLMRPEEVQPIVRFLSGAVNPPI